MKHLHLFILAVPLSFIFFSGVATAADPVICNPKEFSCFKQQVASCTDTKAPWAKGPDLGALTLSYEEFKPEKFDALITTIPASQTSPTEQKRMQAQLDALKSKEYAGFRAAEVVRIQYRSNMNKIFACAIIASRQDKLQKLREVIKGKNGASDIEKSLEKEEKRYASLMANMNCNQNKTDSASDKVTDRLASSAAKEYCKYTHYLDYLEANITSDFTEALKIDAKITGTGVASPNTTDDAAKRMSSRISVLENERTRAQDTVPKAVMAFQEMDRTYVVHLLLVVIYDDYLKLREHLNTYLSIVSQTFEKAFNAQDANKR